MGNAGIKILLVIFFTILLAMIGWGILIYTMREKLIKGWKKYFTDHNRKFPENIVRSQLIGLGYKELNLLIKFSQAMNDGNKIEAAVLLPQVISMIATKTDLADFIHQIGS